MGYQKCIHLVPKFSSFISDSLGDMESKTIESNNFSTDHTICKDKCIRNVCTRISKFLPLKIVSHRKRTGDLFFPKMSYKIFKKINSYQNVQNV